ncbi:hypothetical protein C2I36_02180 [Rhodobacteraceae bacterium WD3A24]|nr:hypothetical protein C2I36_02180 [Rhodobacteraceae bacterium WD3A24]
MVPETGAFAPGSGRIEIEFSQNAHHGASPDTLISQDGGPGHFDLSVTVDGMVMARHEGPEETGFFATPTGFFNTGDSVRAGYCWDQGGQGRFDVENLTTGAAHSEPVPPGMVFADTGQGPPGFVIGAAPAVPGGGSRSFDGQVGRVDLFDGADLAPQEAGLAPAAGEDAENIAEAPEEGEGAGHGAPGWSDGAGSGVRVLVETDAGTEAEGGADGLTIAGTQGAGVAVQFAGEKDSGLADAVEGLSFRLSGFDPAARDSLVIDAADPEGAPLPVELVLDASAPAADSGAQPATAGADAATVSVDGRVARLEIRHTGEALEGGGVTIGPLRFETVADDGAGVEDAVDNIFAASSGESPGQDDDEDHRDSDDDDDDDGHEDDDDRDDEHDDGDDHADDDGDGDIVLAGPGDSVDGSTGIDTLVIAPGHEVAEVTIHSSRIEADGSVSKGGEVVFADDSEPVTFQAVRMIVPCFTPGTLIDTSAGARPVEALRPGDRVLTRDGGFRPLAWTGACPVTAAEIAADPSLAPVRIAAGALGGGLPLRDMEVSPQHRMLFAGGRAELLFGAREVLVPAKHLVGRPGITRVAGRGVTYVHVMCDRHEILRADGAWSESFQPGDQSLAGLDAPQRAELLRLFPELARAQGRARYRAARPTLKRHEARVLVAA